MKHRRCSVFVLVLFLGVFQVGCAFLESRSSLRTAYDTYERTLAVLEGYAADGTLSLEAIERVDVAQDLAMQALEAWQEALVNDTSPRAAIAQYSAAVTVLIEERLAAEAEE